MYGVDKQKEMFFYVWIQSYRKMSFYIPQPVLELKIVHCTEEYQCGIILLWIFRKWKTS